MQIAFNTAIPSRNILSDDPCPGVKNIVLVMSGKGGVGKSTVAANLTLALKRMGASVGLLDADMYGPSVPTMLGVAGKPTSTDGTKFLPLERFGVKLMSIGFLLEDAKSAVVWRGPMLQNALLQFLRDVEWGDLDYLILDLPPGTGDIVLTISQKLRTTGAIVVTTPQEVALQDVYKSVSMAQKVGISCWAWSRTRATSSATAARSATSSLDRAAGRRSPILRRPRCSARSRSTPPSGSGATPAPRWSRRRRKAR